ncbi:MAG: EVE domain-containing protein, partial [Saprospiraceae bacterium]
GDWSVVDIVPVKAFSKPVHLKTIKATPELQNIALVRIGRLSVMPLEKSEFEKILALGNTEL